MTETEQNDGKRHGWAKAWVHHLLPWVIALVVLAITASTIVFAILWSWKGAKPSASCPVSYASGQRPLLFGGVSEEGRCRGAACQARGDEVKSRCGFFTASAWGLCTAEQAQNSLQLAKKSLDDDDEFLQFSPCDLLPYLRGRTLWLLGDSHSKTLFRGIQCFLQDFWSHTECKVSPSSALEQELHDQPVRRGYSNCIHLLGPGGGRVCMVEAVVGSNLVNNSAIPQGGVLPLLRAKHAQPHDIFAVNFGTWHKSNGPSWEAYKPALKALGQYYNDTKDSWPHLLFRESSAEHPRDKARQQCKVVPGYTYQPATGRLLSTPAAKADSKAAWTLGTQLSEIPQRILPKYGVHIVPAFNISVMFWNNHIERQHSDELDCTHYCHPGLPEVWLWNLYKAFRSGVTGIQPLPVNAADVRGPAPAQAAVPVLKQAAPAAAATAAAGGDSGGDAAAAPQPEPAAHAGSKGARLLLQKQAGPRNSSAADVAASATAKQEDATAAKANASRAAAAAVKKGNATAVKADETRTAAAATKQDLAAAAKADVSSAAAVAAVPKPAPTVTEAPAVLSALSSGEFLCVPTEKPFW